MIDCTTDEERESCLSRPIPLGVRNNVVFQNLTERNGLLLLLRTTLSRQMRTTGGDAETHELTRGSKDPVRRVSAEDRT